MGRKASYRIFTAENQTHHITCTEYAHRRWSLTGLMILDTDASNHSLELVLHKCKMKRRGFSLLPPGGIAKRR
jgi:hypothetical protein